MKNLLIVFALIFAILGADDMFNGGRILNEIELFTVGKYLKLTSTGDDLFDIRNILDNSDITDITANEKNEILYAFYSSKKPEDGLIVFTRENDTGFEITGVYGYFNYMPHKLKSTDSSYKYNISENDLKILKNHIREIRETDPGFVSNDSAEIYSEEWINKYLIRIDPIAEKLSDSIKYNEHKDVFMQEVLHNKEHIHYLDGEYIMCESQYVIISMNINNGYILVDDRNGHDILIDVRHSEYNRISNKTYNEIKDHLKKSIREN